jgi:16S rRNA (uracil1498-N3)-methyltransferase
MTRRRWIADKVQGDHAYLLGQNATHLFRVLRAQPGQQFDVAANGVLRLGTIVHAELDRVEFHLGEEVPGEAPPEIAVYLALFKFDRLEWALEKLTELGVARVVPVVAARSGSHLVKAAEARVERWRKIARESAQQARRLGPPEIAAPVALKKALAPAGARDNQTGGLSHQAEASRIVLSETETSVSLKHALVGCSAPLVLAFGPEGGWTAEEVELFRTAGWKSATLGATILRAETAAIAAVAVAMSELS